MPIMFAPLVGALIAWGTRAAATYGLARLFSEEPVKELEQMVYSKIASFALERAGLNLDPEDPLSDASLSNAVSERVGFAIRTLKDKNSIIEDVEGYGLRLISERSGYQISSITDQAALKDDLQRISLQVLSERLNIPFVQAQGGMDKEEIKKQVLTWAKTELLESMKGDVVFSVGEIIEAGDLEAVANDLNSRLSEMGSIEAVTVRQLALRAYEKMASDAVADFGRMAAGLEKRNRKRELNRAAQAKFRAAHGNRQRYVPLDQELNG